MECTINAACEGLVQGVGCRMYRPSHRNGRLERNMVAVAFKWQLSERNDRLQMSLVSHNPAKFKCHDVTNVTDSYPPREDPSQRQFCVFSPWETDPLL
jgi:hypothetical protein